MFFEQRVLTFIRKHGMIAQRSLVLVGVSGGADSMALLSAMACLRHTLGIRLHAVHFNHRLRKGALHDQRFVASWCKKLNVPLSVGVRQGVGNSHVSEDAARRMRFEFFVKTASELKAHAVALAHTRNDLAETVLIRVLRGSGLYGLQSILPRRVIDGVLFLRPLMSLNRSDVETYLKVKRIGFCTDITNNKLDYLRNKVRLKLLPQLADDFNPKIVDALAALAATAADDYEFIARCARSEFEKFAVIQPKKIKLPLQAFKGRHPSIMRLMFRFMAEGLNQGLGFDEVGTLEQLIHTPGKDVCVLSHRLKAIKGSAFLELCHV